MSVLVQLRYPRPQLGQSKRNRIPKRAGLHRLRNRGARALRRRCSRLPDLHVNDVTPCRFGLSRSFHHIHNDKWVDL